MCSHYADIILYTVQYATRTNAATSRQYQVQDRALLIQSCGKSVHAKPMVRSTLLPDMFRHHEKKQATLLDMQTVRSVAVKQEFLTSLTRLGTSDVILAEKEHGTCLGRVQVKYNWSDIQQFEGRTLYKLQSWNVCSSSYRQ